MRGDAARALLIETYIEAVARYGLEGTTISRLSALSGQSRGLVSFHFQGKDNLIEAALDYAIGVYARSWEKHVLSGAKPAADRIRSAIDHDLAFTAAHPEILALWWAAWGEARAKAIYGRLSTARDESFVNDLRLMFAEAGLGREHANAAALAINAYLLGCWLQHHVDAKSWRKNDFRSVGNTLVESLIGSRSSAKTAGRVRSAKNRGKI